MEPKEQVILNHLLKNNIARAERRILQLFKQKPDLTIAADELKREIAMIYAEVGLTKSVLYFLIEGQIEDIEFILSTKF